MTVPTSVHLRCSAAACMYSRTLGFPPVAKLWRKVVLSYLGSYRPQLYYVRLPPCPKVRLRTCIAPSNRPVFLRLTITLRGPWFRLLIAPFLLVASPALAAQGTAAERQACTPDVFRLCSALIPDAISITACLRERKADLSEDCKNVISDNKGIERSLSSPRHPTRTLQTDR